MLDVQQTPLNNPTVSSVVGVDNALEHQGGSLGLLISAVSIISVWFCSAGMSTYPSSKCLHRFSDNCDLVLHLTHSKRSTTFLVVLAFLWKTGFV
jgi:hypothetical protein